MQLTVATLNLHHGADPQGRDCLAEIAEHLTQLPWQILALQELDRNTKRSGRKDQVKIIQAACKAHAHFTPALKLQGGQYGNAILWRETDATPAGSVRLPQAGQRETRNAALIESQGKLIAATHLTPNPQAARRQIQALAQHPDKPALILGDLNLTESQLGPLKNFSSAGPSKPTYPAEQPRKAIDHILYNPLEWQAEETITAKLPATDHLYLEAKLTALN